MNDIFISYASEDKDRVQPLARALEREGLSVWWDRQISAGRSFEAFIRNALDTSKVVVVVWTEASVKSEWVQAEAREGLRRRVLFPVMLLEEVEIPFEFKAVHAAQLMDWQPEKAHSGFDQFVQDIARILGRSSTTAIHRSSKEPLQKQPFAQRKSSSENKAGLVSASRELHWYTWLGQGLRIGAFVGSLALFLFGVWIVTQWGLTELSASAEARPESLVCQTLDGMGPEMMIVPPGSFQMGANTDYWPKKELPRHSVAIRTFGMSTCEVTFDEYDRFAKTTDRPLPYDEGWGRGRRPVINVSWNDAKAYAAWLSKQTGKRYRLPTEAEWEYAAQSAGRDENWAWISDEQKLPNYAVYKANSNRRTALVESKKPNSLGLYDMSGNVEEWVEDCAHQDTDGTPSDGSAWLEANGGDCGLREIRGGFGSNRPEAFRASDRSWSSAGTRDGLIGFRLAQDLAS